MKTIGRNDPCPCGSGKKYKRCCGAATTNTPESRYDRIRRLDGEADLLLVKFARNEFGPDVLEYAWEDFQFGADIPLDETNREFQFFLRWFLFNWPFEEPLAARCLARRGKYLSPDLRRFLELTLAAPYSYYQVLDVQPGTGTRLRDILRKQELDVHERTASTMLQKGSILFAHAVEMDDIFFLMGNGTVPLAPTFLNDVLELREFLETMSTSPDQQVTDAILLDAEEELRMEYFELAEQAMNPTLVIRNTEGDTLVFHKLTYAIPSLERAFHALKDLEQTATRGSDADLLANAETDSEGKLKKVWIHWWKKRRMLRKPRGGGVPHRPSLGGSDLITHATLEITDTKMVVEVNSKQRADRIRREISKRLGDEAVLLGTEVTPLDEALAKAERRGTRDVEDEHDRILREHPEIKVIMQRRMDDHWAAWPDTPLPALRGMTPREAANDPVGRELLESVLMDFEVRNRQQKDGFLRVDVDKLRRDLGLG